MPKPTAREAGLKMRESLEKNNLMTIKTKKKAKIPLSEGEVKLLRELAAMKAKIASKGAKKEDTKAKRLRTIGKLAKKVQKVIKRK